MGFLKFLKREKKGLSFEGMDLPPSPPSLKDIDGNLPSNFVDDLPELPHFSDLEDIRVDKGKQMDFMSSKMDEKNMPPMPAMEFMPEQPKMEPLSKMPQFPENMPPSLNMDQMRQQMRGQLQYLGKQQQEDAQKISQRQPRDYSKISGTLMERENSRPMRLAQGPLYIKVEKFKLALGSINVMRSDLKKSDYALSKLENIKTAKDKSFEKMKSLVEDTQKKLIFIDKTLFRGE